MRGIMGNWVYIEEGFGGWIMRARMPIRHSLSIQLIYDFVQQITLYWLLCLVSRSLLDTKSARHHRTRDTTLQARSAPTSIIFSSPSC